MGELGLLRAVYHHADGLLLDQTFSWLFRFSRVFFDGQNLTRVFQQQCGERAQARADLQHFIRFLQLGCFDYTPQLVAVVKEILAEGFCEADLPLGQNFAHFR